MDIRSRRPTLPRLLRGFMFIMLLLPAISNGQHSLIPAPLTLQAGTKSFTLTAATAIGIGGKSEAVRNVAGYLSSALKPATGFSLKLSEGHTNAIQLTLNAK